jgi:hypothetical protein
VGGGLVVVVVVFFFLLFVFRRNQWGLWTLSLLRIMFTSGTWCFAVPQRVFSQVQVGFVSLVITALEFVTKGKELFTESKGCARGKRRKKKLK